jgi:hypothetical protein
VAEVLRAFDDALDLDWEHESSDTGELASTLGLGRSPWPVSPRLVRGPIG